MTDMPVPLERPRSSTRDDASAPSPALGLRRHRRRGIHGPARPLHRQHRLSRDPRRASPASSTASLSWVLNAYAIVFAACLVPAGRLADLLGRRRTFQLGLIVFAVASAACAAAPTLGDPRRGARRPGGRRRAPDPDVARPAAPRLPAGAARGRGRRLGRRRRDRRRRRPGSRRPPRRGELEAHLPRQHPARRRRRSSARGSSSTRCAIPRTAASPTSPGIGLLIAGIGGVVLAIVEGPQWGWTSVAALATLAVCRREPRRVPLALRPPPRPGRRALAAARPAVRRLERR